jgi:hypothetical protein
MRFAAVMLLLVASLCAVRASTDRVSEAHAVRSTAPRLLLMSIASPGRPSPPSPWRRQDAFESALDQEEASDLDPLGCPPLAVAIEPFCAPDAGPFSIVATSSSDPGQTRSRRLRC